MQHKFNIKLAVFLVGLFSSLIFLIVGSNNKYCLSFGFVLLGISLATYIVYNNDKTAKNIQELDLKIEEIDLDKDLDEDRKDYVVQELYKCRGQFAKQKKKTTICFGLGAFLFVIIGVLFLF